MLTLRFGCAFGLACVGSVAHVAAQSYAQGYGQQQQQPQYPEQQQQYQQQYPQQQDMQQQQPPPGYFPTPDAQGSYGYQQQYAPNAMYPQQQEQGYAGQPAAEEPTVSSVQGAFQISAGLGLLQYQSLTISQSGMNPPATVDPMAMPGAPPVAAAPSVQQVLYGKIDRHPINLELGYGLSKNILLGAILSMSGAAETLEINGQKAPVSDFMFTLAPKLDYQLSPTSRFNPFIGGVVSLTLHNKKSWPYKDSRTLFGVAARGGIRYFVLEQLSIDPALSLGYMFGSATQKVEGTTPIEFEDSVSGPFFNISMGVSVYLK